MLSGSDYLSQCFHPVLCHHMASLGYELVNLKWINVDLKFNQMNLIICCHWTYWKSSQVQVMACCLMAPSRYLNQCWIIINGLLWHPLKTNSTGISQVINLWNEFEKYTFEIIATSQRGHWINHTITATSPRVQWVNKTWNKRGLKPSISFHLHMLTLDVNLS